jgi:isocitrate dehydrogenase
MGEHFDNPAARLLGETLDEATAQLLLNRKAPSRKVHELDNRGSQFYLALYWARALAAQTTDRKLAARFVPVAEALGASEAKIVGELNAAQGPPQDIGGYYRPDRALAEAAMRPSRTLNEIIDGI